MKRKAHYLVAATFGVIVFLGEFGCMLAGEPFETANASESEVASANANTAPSISLQDPIIFENIQPSAPIMGDLVIVPAKKDPPANQDEPNGIILETCEPDPDEVAVPLNVSEDKECHKVHAQAIYADAMGAVNVEARYSWVLGSEDAVSIVDGSAGSHEQSIELQANYDIFSYNHLTGEPSTILRVCVEPINGWANKAHEPLCRSLPVFAVANMEGSWCFSGNKFQPDPGANCQSLTINQDGRFLTVEGSGQGTIYEKQLDFYYENLGYRTNKSSSTEIEGIILAGNDVEGIFEAFRLPF
ncbi:hypothetical protein GF391_00390 [Candidatus Uhrbacteria bacterium]|nr:hypothetical protein [Candidatus Uhrbacteria bacterium]